MDAEYASHYTTEVMLVLIREFQSPDEEMKKIVLKVIIFVKLLPNFKPQAIFVPKRYTCENKKIFITWTYF